MGKVIDSYCKFMVDVANNPAHGYSQYNRRGNPDYDCSSLVITALKHAGINTAGATYTGNMLAPLLNAGFKNVKSKVNVYNASGMKKGDILLNTSTHTGVYLGNGKMVAARSAEGGGISGRGGDQTGDEIAVHNYYNHPWTHILRYSKEEASSESESGYEGVSSVKDSKYKLQGIDVSNHQQGLDFSRNDFKLDFIIAKASEGVTFKDNWFSDYYNDATNKKIRFGAYHFLQAKSEDEAIKEADFFLNAVKGYKCDFGYWCDVEAKTFELSKTQATKVVKAFCKYIKDKGHYIGIYASEYWGFSEHLNKAELLNFPFWVANWQNEPKLNHVIWQYTSTASIPGFNVVPNGTVDVDKASVDISQIIKRDGGCGFAKNPESTGEINSKGEESLQTTSESKPIITGNGFNNVVLENVDITIKKHEE
ncbi:MAG: GH25 family lysozyme [Peptoniphilaceae bacterium]|nr:GH25 family lysozyme [Peptoniphilaceae bacterium]